MSARLLALRRRVAGWLRGHAAAVAVLLVAATLGGWGLRSVLALGSWTINQTFTTATATGWTLNASAALTSGGVDTAGNGWLRLNGAVNSTQGWAYHSNAFTASQGLTLEFDWATWGGNGADGIGVALYDANATVPASGLPGGGTMAIAGSCSWSGWPNLYLALALDEYGGFSNNGSGCPASGNASGTASSIALRGAGNGTSGYPLLGLSTYAPGIAVGARPTSASDPNYRRISLSLIPYGSTWKLTVTALNAANRTVVFNQFTVPAPTYTTLKIGLTASNGGLNNIHEIRNFNAGPAAKITGTVFEDVNYGGGAGRNRATAIAAGGTGRANARVELYDASGSFLTATTTDATGAYALMAAPYVNHTVRVVSSTVSSARAGYTNQLPVQTYRTDASTGTVTDMTNKVGGENPNLPDAGNGSTTLAALTTASATPHSIATVQSGSLGIDNVDFGYNFSTIVNTNDSGQGSLRQWMTNANALGGQAALAQAGRTAGIESSIFVLPTTSTGYQALTQSWRISPTSALPTLTANSMTLDGLTQSGAAAGNLWAGTPHTLKVELNGTNAVLNVTGTDVTVRGLVVGGSTNAAVNASGTTRFTLRTSYIGVDVAGTTATATAGYPVYLSGTTDSEVGGLGTGDGNVVAGSANLVAVLTNGGTGFAMRGNFIGSNAAGTAALSSRTRGLNNLGGTVTAREIRRNLFVGNTIGVAFEGDDTWQPVAGQSTWSVAGNHFGVGRDGSTVLANTMGIAVWSATDTSNVSGLVIGGTTAADRNVIAGNTSHGIWLRNPTGAVQILGNYIGVAADGTTARGNGGDGIRLETGQTVAVGGVAAGQGNVIANSIGKGVNALSGTGAMTVRGNTMYGNGSPGLDLGGNGVTVNDGAKTAGQPNQYMDFPVLTSAVWNGDQLHLVGWVGSAAGQTTFAAATVDVYKSSKQSSGYGEGQVWLGTLTADANGNLNGRLTLPAGVTLAGGDALTATAIDAAGYTSEFAANLTITAAAGFQNGKFDTVISGFARPSLGGWITIGHGDTRIAGWTALHYNIDWQNLTSSTGFGPFSIDTSGNTAGGFQQSFTVTTGARYTVTWDAQMNTSCTATTGTYTVSAMGSTTTSGSYSVAGATYPNTASAPFLSPTLTFTADSPLTTLTFQSTTSGCGGPVITNVRLTQFATLSGTVFEDLNYGGGPGRSLAAATGEVGIAGARVELYDSTGALTATTTTAAGGVYSFSAQVGTSYTVRVVNATVASSRAGWVAGLLPVQTYRTAATGGTAVDVLDRVGGETPALVDAGNGSTTLAALTTATTTAQSITPVTPSASATSVPNLDFGFHFGTVVNTNDSGQGSLRQVITNANALGGDAALAVAGRAAGVEHVVFMIPNGTTGSGGALGLAAGGLRTTQNAFTTAAGGYNVATIAPQTALPAVTATLVIDGQTQPGWTLNPVIELSGAGAGSSYGLVLNAANTVLRGLIVNRFGLDGIFSTAGAGITIQGVWSGVNAAGTAAAGNAASGIWISSTANGHVIGGTASAQRNVVSGNVAFEGIAILGGSGHLVQGNYVGVDAAGTAAIGNGRHGILFYSGATNSTIGGTAAGAGNVVAANKVQGIYVQGSGITIAGNRVGTNATGTAALPNTGNGVVLEGANHVVGGAAAGAGNLISGNGFAGVYLGSATTGNQIKGNLIGLNAGGTAAIGNAAEAITINYGSSNNVIGGTTAAERNVMSGNGRWGVYIGNGNSNGNQLLGNYIGTNAAGTASLPNAWGGVSIRTTASNNVIGGVATGAGNLIQGNASGSGFTGAGVSVADSGTGNTLRGNSISGNAGLGIDLGDDGVTANDGVKASGKPNLGIDMPVFTTVAILANQFQVTGYVGSAPGQTAFANAIVDVYKSSAATATGFGDGKTWLGTLTADASGNFTGTITPPSGVTVVAGDIVTATATDAAGNTSEFSANATVYSTQIVNNNGDANDATPGDGICATVNGGNVCTLRAAITESNALAGPQYIRFALPSCPGAGCTITPTSALPTITDATIVDGQTQAGWSSAPIVVVNGASAGLLADGITVNAANSTIRGLVIGGFSNRGVNFTVLASGGVLEGSYVGINAAGTTAFANGSNGVLVQGGTGVRIGGTTAALRNVIAGNGAEGVSVTGGTGHVIQGSYIGLNAAGNAAVGNGGAGGVLLQGTTSGVRIGGTATGAGNVISGNVLRGVLIYAGAHTIQGNYIGTDATGAVAIRNNEIGIGLDNAAGPSTIGGTAAAARNVISGNLFEGIYIGTATAAGTVIQGNYVGVNAAGNAALANGRTAGIVLLSGASAATGVQIGGTVPGAGNVISGNSLRGVLIQSGSHTIQGNTIGLNAAGTAALANGNVGIGLDTLAGPQTIGGATPGAGNVISGNAVSGLWFNTAGPSGTTILGNYIGTNASGTAAIGNQTHGIYGMAAATGLQIGAAGAGNVISGNGQSGIYLEGGSHTIQGNTIGLNAAGTAMIGNAGDGIALVSAHAGSTIGGTASGAGNVIGGNGQRGVYLAAGTAILQGNLIGTNAAGTAAMRNASHGVASASTGALTIGGTASGARNVISGNGSNGIDVSGSGAATIQGNYIGVDAGGTYAIANAGAAGVYLYGSATGATVGGTATGAGNVISGNANMGVRLDTGTHTLQGNTIGTNAAGTYAVANGAAGMAGGGIYIQGGSNHQIGGTTAAARNLLSGNGGAGIWMDYAGTATIQGNYIGTDATGSYAVGNGRWGISLGGFGSISNVQIGGTVAGAGNLISGNTAGPNTGGIYIMGNGNVVEGNQIGTNAAGTALIPNGGSGGIGGVEIRSGSNNRVGGTTAASANVIAGNVGAGIAMNVGTGNQFLRNAIYGNSALGIDVGGGWSGSAVSPGVTSNDGLKDCTKSNCLMDYAVITSARARGPSLTVAGYVGTGTGQALFAGSRIDVYQSDGDASGYGEGQVWLGTLTADANGRFSGTVTMPVNAIKAGSKLTATATDTSNNTSEFGPQFSGATVDWLVNDPGDAVDANVGDGLCETATPGICTLRAAIMESNARTGADVVAFALPGCTAATQAACTITPSGSALPTITETLTVDATTQAGYSGTPLVQLVGTAAGSGANGLTFSNAGASSVSGFVINRFGGVGIWFNTGTDNGSITGNWVGLSADGTTASGNGAPGIRVSSSGTTIGGTTASARNVISGNGTGNLEIVGNTTTVIGNWIGLNATGSAAVTNPWDGIRIGANGTIIGGTVAGQGNVIGGSAAPASAIAIFSGTGTTVQGNVIGLNATRTATVANGNGVWLQGGNPTSATTIGGTSVGAGNLIANNAQAGVTVWGNTGGVTIIGNAMYGNGRLGIDLAAGGASAYDGATVNDGLKPVGTANLGMDMPVINTVGTDGSTLTVDGYVGSVAGQTLFGGARIDFYVSDGDGSGYGEGRLWLGTLTAGADGRFSGSIALPVGAFAVGNALTATATDAAGNTSEFSANKTSVSLASLLPGLFNAFDSTVAVGQVSGPLTTKTAGVPFSAAVVALNSLGTSLNLSWAGTVSLEWMDASDNSGALGANNCRASWVSKGTAGSVALVAGSGRGTVSITPPNAGRNWRLRMSATALGATVTACSTDPFAVKPADLAITQVGDADAGTGGLARTLNNVAASGGVVHKAGQPFSLRATARDAAGALTTGYDGSPRLSVASCVLPAAGCTLGTLTYGTLAASGGLVSSDTLAYSEVGSITANLVDDTFADVDAADGTPLSTRTITGTAVTLGRFVPDHYRLTVSTAGKLAAAQNACAAAGKGFTFVGQSFAWSAVPTLTVTAENASGAVTRNWTGALQKLTPASHLTRALSLANAGSLTLTPSWGTMTLVDGGNGTATVAFANTDRFLFGRDAAVPVASFQPLIDFVIGVADTSEGGVAGNPTVAALSSVRASNASALPFDNGGYFHYGRLKLQNAFGDARRNVSAQVELQYYDGANWLRLDDDRGCLTMNANAFGITSATGFLASNACAAPVQAAVTTSRGRATVTLAKSPGNLPGSASLVINALGSTEGASCIGSPAAAGTPVSMAMPYLATVRDTANQDSNPLARIVWGRIAREWIALRELY